jgi:hypothetical protein
LVEEITVLPKPKLQLWIICPFCGYKFYTYKKKFKRIICPKCESEIRGQDLENSTYYYDKSEGILKKYPLSVVE